MLSDADADVLNSSCVADAHPNTDSCKALARISMSTCIGDTKTFYALVTQGQECTCMALSYVSDLHGYYIRKKGRSVTDPFTYQLLTT